MVGGGAGLRSLDLRGNALSLRCGGEAEYGREGTGSGEACVRTVCKALSTGGCCALTSLDLGANYMKEDGAAAVSEMLRCNSTLVFLGLAGNRLGNCGEAPLLDLAGAVGDQPGRALRVLDLRDNGIHFNEAARVLSRRLLAHSQLRELNGRAVTAWMRSKAETGCTDPDRGDVLDGVWLDAGNTIGIVQSRLPAGVWAT